MLILNQQITDYHSINIKSDYATWSSGTTYNFGEIVFYGHYYYKSMVDSNLGLIPTDNTAQWLKWEVSNKYAAIDLQARTTTVCNASTIDPVGSTPHDLVIEFENDRFDSIALGEVYGSIITIEVFKDPDYTTPNQTIVKDATTIRECVNSWYNFYYCPLASEIDDPLNSLYYRLEPVQGRIRVTITAGIAGYSAVSYLVAGQSQYIGDTQYGLNIGIEDFSYKEIDDFGILNLKRREARQLMDIDVAFDAHRITEVTRIVRNNLGKVVLFINDESDDSAYENLLLLGLIDDFNTILSNNVSVKASFTLSEVI